MADGLFGGHITMMINGKEMVMRGTFELSDTSIETKEIVNLNGTVSSSATPMAYEAEFSLEDVDGIDWNKELLAKKRVVTIVEADTLKSHIFYNARLFGKSQVDRMTGERTGIKLAAEGYIARAY